MAEQPKTMTRDEIYSTIKDRIQKFIVELKASKPEAATFIEKSVTFCDSAKTINFKKVDQPKK